jgi:hypothetical protein
MGRRKWPYRYECNHPGCTESAHHEFSSRADLMLQLKWVPRDKWFCVRHTNGGEVLSKGNRVRVTELSNFEVPHGKFWGTDKPQSGFLHGPGFKAFAEDFPPGAKIRVTAELILPEPDLQK